MRIAIIAAMEVELEELLSKMQLIACDEYYGRKVYRAKFGKHKLFLGVSGIGKTNVSSFTQLLLDKYGELDLVINTGIAGSLDPSLSVLSLVVADKLCHHDFPDYLETYPGTNVFSSDDEIRDLCINSLPQDIRDKTKVGTIASGDDFISSSAKKKEIVEKTGAIACDMESASIAQIATGAGLPCLIIRSISDEADEEANETYDNFEKVAADQSVEVVISLLESL